MPKALKPRDQPAAADPTPEPAPAPAAPAAATEAKEEKPVRRGPKGRVVTDAMIAAAKKAQASRRSTSERLREVDDMRDKIARLEERLAAAAVAPPPARQTEVPVATLLPPPADARVDPEDVYQPVSRHAPPPSDRDPRALPPHARIQAGRRPLRGLAAFIRQ